MAKKNMKQRWNDMTPGKRVVVMVLTSVQVSLAVTAWTDLAKRPANQVDGKKGMWAAIIAVNFIGPVAYFLKGRQAS